MTILGPPPTPLYQCCSIMCANDVGNDFETLNIDMGGRGWLIERVSIIMDILSVPTSYSTVFLNSFGVQCLN